MMTVCTLRVLEHVLKSNIDIAGLIAGEKIDTLFVLPQIQESNHNIHTDNNTVVY